MPFRSRRVRSRRVRRASGSRRTKRAGRTNSGGVSFAAKLGAFMLESVQGKIVFSMEDGFTSKHPQVFGVLPYLHMNFSERTFRNDSANSDCKEQNDMLFLLSCFNKKITNPLQKLQTPS